MSRHPRRSFATRDEDNRRLLAARVTRTYAPHEAVAAAFDELVVGRLPPGEMRSTRTELVSS
jgi:hypothetical protein